MENNFSETGSTIEHVIAHIKSAHEADPTLLVKTMDGVTINPEVGIGIKRIEELDTMAVGNQVYAFYGARVFPASENAKPFVKPHRHMIGNEPYFFPTAGGEMNIGVVVESDGTRAVQWRDPFVVQAGATVIVAEGEVHSFRNLGTIPVDFYFACPDSHLVDIEAGSAASLSHDREVVMSLPGGIPKHYSEQ